MYIKSKRYFRFRCFLIISTFLYSFCILFFIYFYSEWLHNWKSSASLHLPFQLALERTTSQYVEPKKKPIKRVVRRGNLRKSDLVVDQNHTLHQYSIHPGSCDVRGIFPYMVILVINKPSSFRRRQAIRQTWGTLANPTCGLKLYFMLGKIYDKSVQDSLIVESSKHNDIIQSNQFEDQYRASSLKTLHAYQWVAAFCNGSTFTVRTDDDMWLNVPRYYSFLKNLELTDAVYGYKSGYNAPVNRRTEHKYGVQREEYSMDFYPEYVSGMLFAFPTNCLVTLLYYSRKVTRVFLDDVYVTGLLAKMAGYSYVSIPDMAFELRANHTACPKRDLMSIHYVTVTEMFDLWKDSCYVYDEICPE